MFELGPRSWLPGALGLAMLAAGCTAGTEVIHLDDPGWEDLSREEAAAERLAFDELFSELRIDNGQRTLAMDDRLNQAAQDYAAVQAPYQEDLSHTGPDGSTPRDRALAAGYDADFIAENLAYGLTSDAAVLDAWMDSPGHRENMLDPRAEDFGIGRDGVTWVLLLGSEDAP